MTEIVYSLVLKGSDGMQYYASLKDNLELVQQRLGICALKAELLDAQTTLRIHTERLEDLEQPARLGRILDLMRDQPQGRTERWISRRVPVFRYNDLILLREQKILEISRKGKTILYILKGGIQ